VARDGSGTYTLPAGNPVITGTAIDSSDFNDTMNDLASEMTDSLSRSGSGSMTAGLPGFVGTVSLPGYAWSGDLNTGLYWVSADLMGIAIGGVNTLRFGPNGTQAANGTVSLPSYSFLNDLDCGPYRIGADNIGYAIGGVKILDIQGAATGGLFVNNTTTGAGSERVLTTSDLITAPPVTIFTVKTAQEGVASSTTLQDDDELTGIVITTANKWYKLRAVIECQGGAGGFRFGFVWTNALVAGRGVWTFTSQSEDKFADASSSSFELTDAVVFNETNNNGVSVFEGVFLSHATTPGTFKLQWAQQTSNATDSFLEAGSYIEIVEIT